MFVQLFRAGLAAIGAFFCCDNAVAKVVRFEITRSEFYGSFRAGDFVRYDGRAVGELAAEEPMPGLDKAPKNRVAGLNTRRHLSSSLRRILAAVTALSFLT